MSGLAWIILDAVLALATVIGAVKVAITPPPKPIPAAQLAISEEKAKNAEKTTKDAQKDDYAVVHADALSPKASLDDLWKETLFLPGRAEAEQGDAEAEAAIAAAELAKKNFEFELVGIAQISPKEEKATPVAILRSKQTGGRNTRNRGAMGRDRNTNKDDKKAKGADEPAITERLVFKEGDSINGTGYLIKAIYPDQKMVEISRGSETIKLTINFAGEDANKRRDAVNQASAKKKQEAAKEAERQVSIREKQAREAEQRKAEEQAKREANPGTPPPPPGAMGNNSSTEGNVTDDRQNAAGKTNSQDFQTRRAQARERVRERMRQRNSELQSGNATNAAETPEK